MCAVLTVGSIVRYRTGGIKIVNICLQLLLIRVLYGTVLQD